MDWNRIFTLEHPWGAKNNMIQKRQVGPATRWALRWLRVVHAGSRASEHRSFFRGKGVGGGRRENQRERKEKIKKKKKILL